MSLNVKIYYGPYQSFHTLSHKPQKLKGLKDQLLRLGYRVSLLPVDYINYCVIEICGHEVFRCNVANLQFNAPPQLDAVSGRAVSAVERAAAAVRRARAHYWLRGLLREQLFARGPLAPPERWPAPEPLRLDEFASCADCVECCHILLTNISNAH